MAFAKKRVTEPGHPVAVIAGITGRRTTMEAGGPARRSRMANGTRHRVVARVLLVGLLCGVMGWAATEAMAVPAAAEVDINAEQRFLIEQLTADKAITVARERRLADSAQEELYKQLEAKDRAQRAAEARASGNAAELARVRKARDQIAR
jgi:hypothetical protein